MCLDSMDRKKKKRKSVRYGESTGQYPSYPRPHLGSRFQTLFGVERPVSLVSFRRDIQYLITPPTTFPLSSQQIKTLIRVCSESNSELNVYILSVYDQIDSESLDFSLNLPCVFRKSGQGPHIHTPYLCLISLFPNLLT